MLAITTGIKIIVLFVIMTPIFFIPFLGFFISTNMMIFGDVSARSIELAPWAFMGLIGISALRSLKSKSIRETPLAIFAPIKASDKHPVRTLMSYAHSTFLWIVLSVGAIIPSLLNHPVMSVVFFYQSVFFVAITALMLMRGVPKTSC